jgi:hypothetical protein
VHGPAAPRLEAHISTSEKGRLTRRRPHTRPLAPRSAPHLVSLEGGGPSYTTGGGVDGQMGGLVVVPSGRTRRAETARPGGPAGRSGGSSAAYQAGVVIAGYGGGGTTQGGRSGSGLGDKRKGSHCAPKGPTAPFWRGSDRLKSSCCGLEHVHRVGGDPYWRLGGANYSPGGVWKW